LTPWFLESFRKDDPMEEKIQEGMKAFCERLGLKEEPLGMFYTDKQPEEGFSPKPGKMPTREMEAKGEINWGLFV
jgi:hypothetical protein